MKQFALICLTIASVLLLKSCNNPSVADLLDTIDTYINESPDSALFTLQNIDKTTICSKSCLNHYNLLLAQAKDKCYIDETNDSVMLSVVDYYAKVRDKEKLFMAYYYLGRIQQNDGRYTESILSYLEAEQLIEDSDNELQKGLLYAHFGKLYEHQMDFSSALSAYEQAAYYYDRAGSLPHQYYTTIDIGQLYLRMGDYAAAEPLIKDVLEWACQSDNNSLVGHACDLLCMLYEATGDFQSLNYLLDSKYAAFGPDSLIRNLSLAYKYAMNNEAYKMRSELNDAWKSAISATDTATIYHREYQLYKLLGENDKALCSHENLLIIQDSLVRHALQQPLQYIQAEYFKAKASYIDLQASSRNIIAILVITLLLIIICCIVIAFRKSIERKNMEVELYMEQAIGLRNDLYNKVNEATVLSSIIDDKDSDIRNMEYSIAELFTKQYKLLDKLCTVYYETHGCSKDRDAIYKQVKTEIERFSSDKKFLRELECIVNSHTNGAMRMIRLELPHLSEKDFRLLCFLLAGFSAKAISVFTGDSTGNIYVRKSRLKTEIQAIDSQTSNKILAHLL